MTLTVTLTLILTLYTHPTDPERNWPWPRMCRPHLQPYSSTNPENLAKIGPVDFEILLVSQKSLKNNEQNQNK